MSRVYPLLFVLFLHAAAIAVLAEAVAHPTFAVAQREATVAVFIRPRIVEATNQTSPALTDLSLRVSANLSALQIALPAIDASIVRNGGALIAAPTLQASDPALLAPYLKQSALLPGEGATVVLRVEVLETGQPGVIEVDTSSGSRQIDQAAIDYARTQHWYPGLKNHVPQPMWIRWGVRLQA